MPAPGQNTLQWSPRKKSKAANSLRYSTAYVAAGLCLLGLPAKAAGQFSPSSDILGMTLGMSKEQIRQFIDQKFVVSDFQERISQIGAGDYSTPDIVTQFTFQVTPKEEQAANAEKNVEEKKEVDQLNKAGLTSPLDRPVQQARGVDAIAIALSPIAGSNEILSIDRMRVFPKEDRPLVNVLLDTFIEKYGQPTYKIHVTYDEYVWSDAYSTDTAAFSLGCSQITRMVASNLSVGSDDGSIKNAFGYYLDMMANSINDVLRVRPKTGKCGTALHLKIRPSDDGMYVYGFLLTLTDEAKSLAAAKAFSDEFQKNAAQAKQDKLSKDSQKKPQL